MATVLLVVGDATSLTTADSSLKTHIEGLGHTVTPISDETAEAGGGFDAVVVCESASSATVGTKYRDTVKGMVVLEQGLWPTWNFQDTATTATSHTNWSINAVAVLNGGQSGDTQIFSPSASYHREPVVNFGAGAVIVGETLGDPSTSMYYVYESGAAMFSGNAPGRRVALSLLDASIASLTAAGWSLFEGAVTWAIGASGSSSVSPSVSPSASVSSSVSVSASASPSASDAGLLVIQRTVLDYID